MQGINSKLVSSSVNGCYFAKECGMFADDDEEYEAKTFYEKGTSNKMWLESWIKSTKVLTECNKV